MSESVRYDIVQAYSKLVEELIITSGDFRLVENTLGLCGESGEVAEKIKKYFRDEDYSKEDIVKELGDVFKLSKDKV